MLVNRKEDVVNHTLDSREEKTFLENNDCFDLVGVGVNDFLGNEPMKIE